MAHAVTVRSTTSGLQFDDIARGEAQVLDVTRLKSTTVASILSSKSRSL
jgi:hypothetical protein